MIACGVGVLDIHGGHPSSEAALPSSGTWQPMILALMCRCNMAVGQQRQHRAGCSALPCVIHSRRQQSRLTLGHRCSKLETLMTLHVHIGSISITLPALHCLQVGFPHQVHCRWQQQPQVNVLPPFPFGAGPRCQPSDALGAARREPTLRSRR
jgi:hypothetical protein